MTQERTPEQQAAFDALVAPWRDHLEVATSRLSMSVLVACGFVCALESDLSMAIINDDKQNVYRLWPVSGRMVPILHLGKDDAERLAAEWNAKLPEDRQHLRVKAAHYRDVLEKLVETAKDQIAWIEGGCKAA